MINYFLVRTQFRNIIIIKNEYILNWVSHQINLMRMGIINPLKDDMHDI